MQLICIQSRVQCNSMNNMGILQHEHDVGTYKRFNELELYITFLSLESTIMFLNCYNKRWTLLYTVCTSFVSGLRDVYIVREIQNQKRSKVATLIHVYYFITQSLEMKLNWMSGIFTVIDLRLCFAVLLIQLLVIRLVLSQVAMKVKYRLTFSVTVTYLH